MTDIETTLSLPVSLIPRTPVEAREFMIRKSVEEKRMALPLSVINITSSSSLQIRAFTSSTSSGNFIAIFPFDRTFVKSDRRLRRTSPCVVANTICKSPQSASSRSTGIIAATDTPCGIGRMLTIALPLAVRPPIGSRHVFIL